MDREQFVARRRDRWQELDSLVRTGRGNGLRRLQGADIMRLGELYRVVTADLAIARRDFPHDRVTHYLNGLVGRAHPLVYQDQGPTGRRIGQCIRYGFPLAWRQTSPYIGAAFALFLVAGVVSALLVAWHPSLADVLMPVDASRLRGYMQHHQLWMRSNTANHPWAANFIMLNNIQVAVVAFAGGASVGLITIYEMVQNGIMFGATAAMIRQYGLDGPFWSFVVAHGVIELSVVFMAGGAGLLVADAILRPGLRRRREVVPEAARRGIILLCGCVPLLMVAGTIESYISPSDLPLGIKLAVGIGSGILLYSYLWLSRPWEERDGHRFDDATRGATSAAGDQSAQTSRAPLAP